MQHQVALRIGRAIRHPGTRAAHLCAASTYRRTACSTLRGLPATGAPPSQVQIARAITDQLMEKLRDLRLGSACGPHSSPGHHSREPPSPSFARALSPNRPYTPTGILPDGSSKHVLPGVGQRFRRGPSRPRSVRREDPIPAILIRLPRRPHRSVGRHRQRRKIVFGSSSTSTRETEGGVLTTAPPVPLHPRPLKDE